MATETPVTLWLTDEEFAALDAQARRYRRDPEAHVKAWIAADLAEAMKQRYHTQWESRRRALEQDARLAATVDAAVTT